MDDSVTLWYPVGEVSVVRNIPMFTTEYGVAVLVLEKIPYTREAFVRIHSSMEPEILLGECVDFCKAAGAETVYGCGHEYLENFPIHTAIIAMERMKKDLPVTDCSLQPVQPHEVDSWREDYNRRMAGIPNGAYLTIRGCQELVAKGGCYYVRKGEETIGLGVVNGDQIDAVASLKAGCGREVLLALCTAVAGNRVRLEVADQNIPAVKLYKSLDFVAKETISRWYKII